MVQINNGLKLNIPASKLNKMPLNKLETNPETNPETITAQTEGNNSGAQPCRAIKGGSGYRLKPFIIDGRNDDIDLEYMKNLAKDWRGRVYFKIEGDQRTRSINSKGEIELVR